MQTKHPTQIGFSLVELLVVIAIISVLMTLLLPSFRDARDMALLTQCAARQRGVGVNLAAYATEWKEFPTPYGQPGFDASLMDPGQAVSRYTGMSITGNANESYMQSWGAWWVGSVTQDNFWYLNKAYQCTTAHIYKGTKWAAFQGRDQPGYFSTNGGLCSTIRGTTVSDPDTARGYLSPWFVYMNPFTNSQYLGVDWWDDCMAGNDFASLTFSGPSNARYQLPPAGYITGPSYRRNDSRRAQLTCPVMTNFINGSNRDCYEPHGRNQFTGGQNYRAALNPEFKNYLYTDGSVVLVKH